jgi:hypothetical protein
MIYPPLHVSLGRFFIFQKYINNGQYSISPEQSAALLQNLLLLLSAQVVQRITGENEVMTPLDAV